MPHQAMIYAVSHPGVSIQSATSPPQLMRFGFACTLYSELTFAGAAGLATISTSKCSPKNQATVSEDPACRNPSDMKELATSFSSCCKNERKVLRKTS